MARKDALVKLYMMLQSRRQELLHSISDELKDLRRDLGGRAGGDDVDAANESASEELTSQLAQLESRELAQIDRALVRLKEGTYGSCEMCSKRIPVARLNALPYTTVCIECQREIEHDPGLADSLDQGWQKVFDHESRFGDTNFKLKDLESKLG